VPKIHGPRVVLLRRSFFDENFFDPNLIFLMPFDSARRAEQRKLYMNFQNAKIKKLWPVESYGWLCGYL